MEKMSYTKQPPFTQEILHEKDSPFTLYNLCIFHQRVFEAKNIGILIVFDKPFKYNDIHYYNVMLGCFQRLRIYSSNLIRPIPAKGTALIEKFSPGQTTTTGGFFILLPETKKPEAMW